VTRLHLEYWDLLAEKTRANRAGAAPDPFQVPYYELFSHFPTRPLSATDGISITEGGRRVLDQGMPAPIYPELTHMISAESLRHVLALCSHQARSVQFLQDRLRTSRHLTPEGSLYHLLWGIKQGLWKLTPQ